jgi:hypothetical protein
MASIREITTEQFADGTSVGPGRMDRALEAVRQRFSALRKRDIQRRWLPTYYVGGHIGSTTGQRKGPWLTSLNAATESVTIPPAGTFDNPQRVKGARNDYFDQSIGTGNGQLRLWTTAYAFRLPARIVGASWTLVADSVYINDFLYGAGFDGTPGDGDPVEDLFLSLAVDDPFQPDVMELANPEIKKVRFGADSVRISPAAVPAGYADFNPPHPKTLAGLCIDIQNLNIPLPSESRARLALGIPQYNNVTHASGWGANSWMPQYYSFTLTVLESIEE